MRPGAGRCATELADITADCVPVVKLYFKIPLPVFCTRKRTVAEGDLVASTAIVSALVFSFAVGPSLVVASTTGDMADDLPQRL